jgi:hypothetical protein
MTLPAALMPLMTPARTRALWHGLAVAGLIFNAVVVLAWGPRLLLWNDTLGWRLMDLNDLYARSRESLLAVGGYLYSPAVAWLFWPLAQVPWPLALTLYLGLTLTAVVILARRWTPLFLIAFPPILLEALNGNIHVFMALGIWAGLRWPAAWSFLLLTKVTPGVGVLWFAARREWRNLGIAIAATAGIVLFGLLVAPKQWVDWFNFLLGATALPQVGTLPPLMIRLPAAALLVWFAARTDRAWLVPFACVLAMPTIWIQSSALLLAAFPLYWDRARFESPKRASAIAQVAQPSVRPAMKSEGRA